jgi:hypothetical protein
MDAFTLIVKRRFSVWGAGFAGRGSAGRAVAFCVGFIRYSFSPKSKSETELLIGIMQLAEPKGAVYFVNTA